MLDFRMFQPLVEKMQRSFSMLQNKSWIPNTKLPQAWLGLIVRPASPSCIDFLHCWFHHNQLSPASHPLLLGCSEAADPHRCQIGGTAQGSRERDRGRLPQQCFTEPKTPFCCRLSFYPQLPTFPYVLSLKYSSKAPFCIRLLSTFISSAVIFFPSLNLYRNSIYETWLWNVS